MADLISKLFDELGQSDLHADPLHLFLRGARDARIILDVVKPELGRLFRDRHAIDFVLQPHQAVQQGLRSRRASWDVDVDRDDMIDAVELLSAMLDSRWRTGPVYWGAGGDQARLVGAARDSRLIPGDAP